MNAGSDKMRWKKGWELPVCLLIVALWASLASGQEPAENVATSSPIRSMRDLVYRQIEGESLKADIFRPDDQRLRPCVMMIHGGAWIAGDKWDLVDHARELAQAGFVAVTINYRLAPKYKIEQQVDDCQAALSWLSELPQDAQVDLSQLGLWGYSAGAQLACTLATQPRPDSTPIRALVAGGAPCDFSRLPARSRLLAHVMGGTPAEKPELYRQMSPLLHVSHRCPPTLFFHGNADALVPDRTSQAMHQRLLQLGVPSEYVVIENQGHLLTFINAEARRRSIAFLQQHLHGKQ